MFKPKWKVLYGQRHGNVDTSTEQKKLSTQVWSSRTAAALLLIGIIGIAASSFAATPDSLDVDKFDPAKPAIAQAKGFNKRLKAKAPKYKKTHPTKQSQDQDTSIDKAQLLKDIKERKAAIKAAIQSNPGAVSQAALPQEIKDSLPEEAKAEVEQLTDLTGIWRTGHAHFAPDDKRSEQQLAVVTTPDGYNNYVYGSLPDINLGREVKVTGVALDHEVAATPVSGVKVKVTGNQKAAAAGKNIMTLASMTYDKANIQLAQATPPTPPPVVWGVCDNTSTNNELRCDPTAATENLDDNPIHPRTSSNVLIIPITFGNTPLTITTNPVTHAPYTTADLLNMMVGNPTSTAEFYRQSSDGRLNLKAAVLPNWVNLEESGAGWTCLRPSDIDNAIHRRIADGRINITGYTELAYVFNGIDCDHGLAYTVQLGTNAQGLVAESHFALGGIAASANTADQFSRIYSHELGHDFGLNHSHGNGWTPSDTSINNLEYGNRYEIMGYNWDPSSHHLTAFHKWELGWLDTGSGMQYVTAKGTYNLAPLEVSSGVRGLRIPVAHLDATNPASKVVKALVVEYRQPGGDTRFDPFPSGGLAPGVLVNLVTTGEENGGLNRASQLLIGGGGPLTSGSTYRYHDPKAADARSDACITLKSTTPTAATLDIDPGCGAVVTQKQDPIPASQTLGTSTTFGMIDEQGNPKPSYFNNTTLKDSSGVCL